MNQSNQNTDVLEVEAEEIPLEQVIDTTLVKHNVTEMVIASLKEKYGGMKLKDIEDKESYLDIKAARKEVRKVGILTEKICKHGRENAIKIQKMWLNKEKEILGKVAEIENPLNDEIEKFENEVERKEIAEQKLKEGIFINRQSTLSKMGATYDNGSFVLNHISYELELIKQADEDMWNDTILPKYRKVFEEIEAVKVSEENKRKAEIEQAKKEREEFELKREEFKKQQEIFAQQQADLQRQKDEADRKERLAQQRIEDEEKRKANEEQRAIEMEKQKEAAIQQALKDEEIRKQQAEETRLRDLEIAKDKEKYADVVKYLKNTPSYAMKSNIYKGKMNIIYDFIQDL